jgi:hypothetical protein
MYPPFSWDRNSRQSSAHSKFRKPPTNRLTHHRTSRSWSILPHSLSSTYKLNGKKIQCYEVF